MKTDYAGHEQAYRRLRAQASRSGWGDDAVLARDLAILHRVMQWAGFPAAGRVLELGCGAGNVALDFTRRGYEVHGVDIAPTAIEWARESAAALGLGCTFEVADVLVLDTLEAASFDVALDGHCLHCIIGADRARFLASARRVLRPGGALCVRTMCGGVPAPLAMRLGFDAASRCCVRNGVASRYIGLAPDIEREVAEAGFEVLRSEVEPSLGGDDLDELLLLARRP
jgi:ubiquinone/menaquinone biosynthesis C-methylase UbiE